MMNTGKKREELERSHIAPPDIDAGTFPGKPQPCGDTQISGDGLN